MLDALFSARPADVRDLDEWRARHQSASEGFANPFDAAVVAGANLDRAGYAFASGYQHALRALQPDLPRERLAALCATEAGGGHPRAIETRLERTSGGWRVSGEKKFVTLGTQAESLLVVASRGEREGRKELALVAIPSDRSGVALEEAEALPFVPEIPHAALKLENVAVEDSEVLEGDGYTEYLKPFRTIEDLHVHGALLGHAFSVAARVEAPRELREKILAQLASLRQIASMDARESKTHIALAGAFTIGAGIFSEFTAAVDATPFAERWERDKPLLQIAGKVRSMRRDRAWERTA